MQMGAPEVLLHFQLLPISGDGGSKAQPVQVGTNAQNAFHTAHHNGGCRARQPVDMGAAKVGAADAFRRLAMAVRLHHPNLRLVVHGGRGCLHEVFKSTVAVTQQGFRQNQPALGLGEDAAVFLDKGVKAGHQRTVKAVLHIGRRHDHRAVIRIEQFMYPVHRQLGLFVGCHAADHRPGLGIEPHISLRVCPLADDRAVLHKAPDEPVLIPAQGLHGAFQLCLLRIQISHIRGILFALRKLLHNCHCQIELEGNEGGFSRLAQPQAVVPVRVQTGGHSVSAHVVDGEINGPLQMVVNRSFVPIGVGHHLIQQRHIAAFRNVLVNRGEQPEGVVSAVGGMPGFLHIGRIVRRVLMTGIVGVFHQRQSRAVVHLGREHEDDLLLGHFRGQMDDALNVLHRIPIAVAVAQAAVHKGSGSGPQEGHEAVVGIPGVHHGVEFRTGGLYLEPGQLFLPVIVKYPQLLTAGLGGVFVGLQQGFRLAIRLFAYDKGKGFCFTRSQRDFRGQRAAAVAAVIQLVSQIAGLNARGVCKAAVAAQEFLPVAAVGSNLRPAQAEEPFNLFFLIFVDGLLNAVSPEVGLGNKQRVLQVYQVLLVIRLVGEFTVAADGQVPNPVRIVPHQNPPNLVLRAQGHIVHCLGVNPRVVCQHVGVGDAVAALTVVLGQILSHRLPGSGPVVPAVIVPQVDVASGLVKVVEPIPKNSSIGARLAEAVAAGLIGNNRAVLGGAEIIRPGCRGIRPGDDIFPILIVKIAVFHRFCPFLYSR